MKGKHLPWAFMAFHVLLGSSPISDLIGIFSGHVYFFLLEILPASHGFNLLTTPEFVYEICVVAPFLNSITTFYCAFRSNTFANSRYSSSYTPAGARVTTERPPSQASHRWGSGRPLGSWWYYFSKSAYASWESSSCAGAKWRRQPTKEERGHGSTGLN